MTDPVPTRTPSPRTGSGLSEKIGPLPMWGWVAIAAAGGIVVLLWLQNRKSSAATPAPTDTTSASDATISDLQDQLAVVEAQIRETQGLPATPGPAGPAGPPGPTGPGGSGGGTPGTPAPHTQFSSIKAGDHVDSWITGLQNTGLTVNWPLLETWNPAIATNVHWHTNSALNTFIAPKTYRVGWG